MGLYYPREESDLKDTLADTDSGTVWSIYPVKFNSLFQACVTLKSMTDQFRRKDTAQQGTIQINYEEFLTMIIGNKY